MRRVENSPTMTYPAASKPFRTMALTGVKKSPVSASPNIFANCFEAHDRVRSEETEGSAPFPTPILPNIAGKKPSLPAAYTKRPLVNVVALRAPNALALTVKASIRDPIGPKTLDPNITATVLLEYMDVIGKTKKYATFAMM